MRVIRSTIAAGHPDFEALNKIKSAILARTEGLDGLRARFPEMIRGALDFVLDPIRTGRTEFKQLDNVERTFIGLKVEHFVRDLLDVPKGLRDLEIDGMDVDIKNTTRDTWMIPPETYRDEDPLVVIASEASTHRCWLGLMIARQSYLSAPNRDQKRGVLAPAFANILWLIEGIPYPESRYSGLDMDRFRELRKIKGGTRRACQFFREFQRVPVHRTVIMGLLFDQDDYMKRLRGNGGARDILRREGIAVLSGYYDGGLIAELGLPRTGTDEMIAASPRTEREATLMQTKGVIALASD